MKLFAHLFATRRMCVQEGQEEKKDQCHNFQLAKLTSTKARGFVLCLPSRQKFITLAHFYGEQRESKIICSRLIESLCGCSQFFPSQYSLAIVVQT